MTNALRMTAVVFAVVAAAAPGLGGAGSATVSLAVRPAVSTGFDLAQAYGQAAGAGPDEPVTLQYKQCGLYPAMFRDVEEVRTGQGGDFTAQVNVDANGVFRALVGKEPSNEVPVQKRANVRLEVTRFGKFRGSVVAKLSFWHRTLLVQRFDPKLRTWITARKVLLTDSDGAGEYVWSITRAFSLPGPQGAAYRASLSAVQAKPCYLAGTSSVVTK